MNSTTDPLSPMSQRALVLAPHPDDFDVIAVTLRRFRERGNTIFLAVLTSGASGVEDEFCAPRAPTHELKSELREDEQRASCRLFGLDDAAVSFVRLAEDDDGHLRDDEPNYATVRGVLQSHSPDIVFMPHSNDTNADHQRAHRMARRAIAELALSCAVWLNRDAKTIAMREDVRECFADDDAVWKAALLRCHQSQHQRNLRTRGHGLDERVLRVNRASAVGECAMPFAEVFEVETFG